MILQRDITEQKALVYFNSDGKTAYSNGGKMICPYCKKEITVDTGFCPECGQDISNNTRQDQSDSYWEKVNREDTERSKAYKDRVNKEKREARTRKNKVLVSAVLILAVLVAGAFGITKFQQYQTKMINQVKTELIGKTLTAHSSHMEGLGWIHHEYWQLSFVDKSNLDYAYIQTVGPAEDDEQPEYKGTYSYTVSRSIIGKYTIRVNGASYKLKMNDRNVPSGISRG